MKDSDKPLEEEVNGFDADNYVDEDDISEGLYGEERWAQLNICAFRCQHFYDTLFATLFGAVWGRFAL